MFSFYDVKAADITEKLNNGELPPQFIDENCLASEDHPELQDIRIEIHCILKNLLISNKAEIEKNYEFNIDDFQPRILFSLDEEPTAGILPYLKNIYLIISLELIKQASSEDELAGILAHELHHLLKPKLKGKEPKIFSGQIAESACDAWAVYVMRQAGYQSSAFAEFFKRAVEKNRLTVEKDTDGIHSVSNPLSSSHPPHSTRVMQIQDTEVGLDKSGHKPPEKPLLPKSKKLDSLPELKFVQQNHKILQNAGFYEEKNSIEKINIIFTCFKQGDFGSIALHQKRPAPELYYSMMSLEDWVVNTLSKIQPESSQHADYIIKLREIRDWCMCTFLSNYYSLPRWASRTMREYNNIVAQLPKDPILALEAEIKSFVEEQKAIVKPDFLQVKTRAENIVNSVMQRYPNQVAAINLKQHFNYYYSEGFKSVDYYKVIDLDIGESIIPEWDQAAQFAEQEFQQHQTTYIATALSICGITSEIDPRLTSSRDQLLYPYHFLFKLADLNRGKEYAWNEHGHYINPIKITRQENEEKLIADVDIWKELEEPPIGLGFIEFTKKYQPFLKIVPTNIKKVYATNYVFMKEFLNRLKLLPPEVIKSIREQGQFISFLANIRPDHHYSDIDLSTPLYEFLFNKPLALQFIDEQAWGLLLNKFVPKRQIFTRDQPENPWRMDNKNFYDIPEWKTMDGLKSYWQSVDPENFIQMRCFAFQATEFILQHSEQIKPLDIPYLRMYYERPQTIPDEDGGIMTRLLAATDKLCDNWLQTTLENTEQGVKALNQCLELYQGLSMYVEHLKLSKKNNDEEITAVTTPYFTTKLPSHFDLMKKLCSLYETCNLTPADRITFWENVIFIKKKRGARQSYYHSALAPYPQKPNDSYGFQISYTETLADPLTREYVYAHYLESLKAYYDQEHSGKDTSEEWLKEMSSRIIDNSEIHIAEAILTRFADLFVTQRGLSDFIDMNLFIKKEIRVDHNLMMIEHSYRLIELATADADSKHKMLDFLLNPFTEANSQAIYKDYHLRISYLLGEPSELGPNAIFKLHTIHKNFWIEEPLVRAMHFQKLLYTRNYRDTRTEQEIATTAQDYVFNRVLPVTQQNSSNMEARKIAEAYLAASTEGEQSAILSLILATQEPHIDPAARKTRGQVLRMVLDNLGPAGTKLAQAIHSHHATPLDIKRDFASSKSMANRPKRWTLYQLLDETYGDNMNDVRFVGPILGAGAYGITVSIKKYNDDESALTLLRSKVAEKAKLEFATFEKAAHMLVAKDPTYKPVLSMIRQAQSASLEETDMNVALQQDQIAQRLYSNTKIQIAEEKDIVTYEFFTARWINHGERYKETAIVPGLHFADLPENSPEERAEKRRVALAIVTIELRNFLCGKEFDHDRHGAQQRIFGHHIGQFDFGGISLTPPSDKQKYLMGKILGEVFRAVSSGKDLAGSLQKSLQAAKKSNPQEEDFLSKIERAILALNDFNASLTKEDISSIFLALRPEIDPILLKGLSEALAGSYFGKFFAKSALDKFDRELEKAKAMVKVLTIPEEKANLNYSNK